MVSEDYEQLLLNHEPTRQKYLVAANELKPTDTLPHEQLAVSPTIIHFIAASVGDENEEVDRSEVNQVSKTKEKKGTVDVVLVERQV
jgi:hypothetical protein